MMLLLRFAWRNRLHLVRSRKQAEDVGLELSADLRFLEDHHPTSHMIRARFA